MIRQTERGRIKEEEEKKKKRERTKRGG